MSDRHDPDVESFLLLLAARRSPRTVDAYRRDLASFASTLDGRVGDATTEEIEAWLATMRADGRAPSTIARRLAAVRAYLRHLMLMGMRSDNPAAAIAGPRRPRTVPRTLSPAEAERLVDAASGSSPRAMRDRALVELLYGAGLRVSEAVGLVKASVDLEGRIVRVLGKGGKERLVPLGRPAAEALRRYMALGRPHLDRRHRPDLFLNARGGGGGPRRGRPLGGDLSTPPAGGTRGRRYDGALHPRLRPPSARGVLPRASPRAAADRARAGRRLISARLPGRRLAAPCPRPGRSG